MTTIIVYQYDDDDGGDDDDDADDTHDNDEGVDVCEGLSSCWCERSGGIGLYLPFFWDHLSILIHFGPNLGDCLDGASHVTAMRFPQYI